MIVTDQDSIPIFGEDEMLEGFFDGGPDEKPENKTVNVFKDFRDYTFESMEDPNQSSSVFTEPQAINFIEGEMFNVLTHRQRPQLSQIDRKINDLEQSLDEQMMGLFEKAVQLS